MFARDETNFEIEEVGIIKTKAAIVDLKVKTQHYLLGNWTYEKIKNKYNLENVIQMLN